MRAPPLIPAAAARRLFLAAQGLLGEPAPPAPGAELAALRQVISGLGFVQLDSINTVARAHDLILWSRLPGYTPALLDQLIYKERFLFEHWTHDASVIPTAFYPHWRHRFVRDAARLRERPWWRNLLGANCDAVMEQVKDRIRKEGPLRSADFEHPERRGPFWDWKPQKAALEYLWRTGELMVSDRVHFHKIYDLAENVLPAVHRLPAPEQAASQTWACQTAAERLVIFTPRELAQFFDHIDLASARAFCAAATRSGALRPVLVESADGEKPEEALALHDFERRLRKLPEPDSRRSGQQPLRLLCPFDPVIRDRARCLRRFGFDYRFEAFTPEPKRLYGYYVLPILQGETLVGRLSPKLHRRHSVLEIEGLWWERGIKNTKSRQRLLADAVAGLAAFVGARSVTGL